MSSRIILILGAGPNIGLQAAQKFAQQGYKVAIAGRSVKPEVAKHADLSVQADFSVPSSVNGVFEEVKAKLGVPGVVVYNGMSYYSTHSSILSPPLCFRRRNSRGDNRTGADTIHSRIRRPIHAL